MNANKPSLARVKIKFPDSLWISYIFSQFKDIQMEIEYFLPYDLEKSIGNAIIEIIHYNIEEIIKKIENHPSVYEFSILERDETNIRVNVKTMDPY
ncbi:MAG: hypothetical protein GF383_07345, partial [Candidatus Lokiarchaeota archaeon]|nr:hypothetical protein [Candidatus Lokiarchaeota archaeon]MBD3339995.1 hypothetical protein [Candidatus Lokiarchaeota archaeon]